MLADVVYPKSVCPCQNYSLPKLAHFLRHSVQGVVSRKVAAPLKRFGIFSLWLSLLHEILHICWQFIPTNFCTKIPKKIRGGLVFIETLYVQLSCTNIKSSAGWASPLYLQMQSHSLMLSSFKYETYFKS